MKDEIRRSLAEATPGPWEIADTTDGYVLLDADGRELAFCESIGRADDARLIANAPEWLQWQNERIEQLEKALEMAMPIVEHNSPTLTRIINHTLGKEE